ncbi:conserved hypothetical protein [Mycobacterium tuberculosis T92]|nr:conserved hypothetical protein [Mycobacterium tuberculosis T92]
MSPRPGPAGRGPAPCRCADLHSLCVDSHALRRDGMRFLHTADWQLGMTRHFLAGDAQPRYSAARRDAVAGLKALAADVGAEFVVVAGDVFEHNQLAPQIVGQSLEAMRVIGLPVYLLPGNHDPLDASSVYTSTLFRAERPDNVVCSTELASTRSGRESRSSRRRGGSRRPPRPGCRGAGRLPTDAANRLLVAHGGGDALDPDHDKPSLIRLAALDDALTRQADSLCGPLGDKHSLTPGRQQRAGLVLRCTGSHQL